MAEHTFILEFSIAASDFWPVTNRRRLVEHRKYTLLLNTLYISHQFARSSACVLFWAATEPQQSAWGKIKRSVAENIEKTRSRPTAHSPLGLAVLFC